jgi:hypothetical protein
MRALRWIAVPAVFCALNAVSGCVIAPEDRRAEAERREDEARIARERQADEDRARADEEHAREERERVEREAHHDSDRPTY